MQLVDNNSRFNAKYNENTVTDVELLSKVLKARQELAQYQIVFIGAAPADT